MFDVQVVEKPLEKKRNQLQIKAIKIKGLTKKYGKFNAITNIDVSIDPGEIHSLVGQNGAGKSTLLGVLSGRIAPTHGKIEVFDEELKYGQPLSSRKQGIATIYQELTTISTLSALENVFLGQSFSNKGFTDFKEMKKRYYELCDLMKVQVNPSSMVKELSIADQQILEIMRGLAFNSRILILDEPTASLAPPERKMLLDILKSLREKGLTIIYVSHHLDEVLEISDNVTILRNGKKVQTESIDFWDKDKLVSSMMGEDIGSDIVSLFKNTPFRTAAEQKEVLKAEGIQLPGKIKDGYLSIKSGEILGIGGLVGSGRTELVSTIAGLEPSSTGELWIEGKKVKWPKSVPASLKKGIILAPEDRKEQGLILGLSSMENINIINLKKVNKFSFYDRRASKSIAETLANKFSLTRPLTEPSQNLSGGNQQKVLLSKVCNADPKVLIVDEPTRGIDLGVKIEVLKLLKELASEGMAIIVISSELEEVVAVSDRVMVLSKGTVTKELVGEDEITEENILKHAF
ncbi:sugar ABC transporter ATP-binding protein [Halobacillus litoralis]|uniref:sugar ABC transporter ATP-binding protein n=1 Tax=Halobacillus litoralis TaxID=45668 RepID=UPI0024933450|nr:sugar ABC transporter ATP-binding protein [Halobacillus litoralis]